MKTLEDKIKSKIKKLEKENNKYKITFSNFCTHNFDKNIPDSWREYNVIVIGEREIQFKGAITYRKNLPQNLKQYRRALIIEGLKAVQVKIDLEQI